MINRRDFLKNASLFTLGGLMAGKVGSADAAKPVTSETMAAKTVGLQIYSLGKELYADVPGGLKKIKQMGYHESGIGRLQGRQDRRGRHDGIQEDGG